MQPPQTKYGTKRYAYKPHTHLIIYLVVALFIVVAIYAMGLYIDKELITTCNRSPYKRESNPDNQQTALLHLSTRNFLAFWVLRVFFIYISTRLIVISTRKEVVISVLGGLALSYWPMLWLVEFCKSISGDSKSTLIYLN
jgi:uncharacterized membrane protein YjgN (DUF898 family)